MAKLYGSVAGASKEIKALYGSVNGESRGIVKLYGSVNVVSKLIYEKASGVPYGIVYYKATSSATEVQSVELQSVAEFESLCNYSSRWIASVGGGSVTVSNRSSNCIVGVTIGSKITAIPGYFLGGCVYLDHELTIPLNVTSISTRFLSECTNFNQPLALPESLTSIGGYFLFGCSNMTSVVDVGSLDATVATTSNYSFATDSKTAACFATGITIAGANRAAWIRRFPVSILRAPYRQLLNAGY